MKNQIQLPDKGKKNYNVSSKIDTGITNREDDLYSAYLSPDGTDRKNSTGLTRPFSNTVNFSFSKEK